MLSDLIDVEGRDRLHGVLPALLLHRHLVPGLMDELCEVEVEGRPLDLDIDHHARPQQGAPLHAGAELGARMTGGSGCASCVMLTSFKSTEKPRGWKSSAPIRTV
jgi:hypothetical protein